MSKNEITSKVRELKELKAMANELELLKLYTDADKKGKEAIFDILICAVVYGEPFYNEAKELLDNENKAALIECINKWVVIAKNIKTKSMSKAV